MAYTPVAGKWGRISVGATNLEWAGKWSLSKNAQMLNVTSFETTMTESGVVIAQEIPDITNVKANISGKFSLGQIPSALNIEAGADTVLAVFLGVKKPDLGITVTGTVPTEQLAQALGQGADFEFELSVKTITGVKWA